MITITKTSKNIFYYITKYECHFGIGDQLKGEVFKKWNFPFKGGKGGSEVFIFQ